MRERYSDGWNKVVCIRKLTGQEGGSGKNDNVIGGQRKACNHVEHEQGYKVQDIKVTGHLDTNPQICTPRCHYDHTCSTLLM